MKIRNGFVSNSSSSSFICEVCNEKDSGWDMSLSDAGMFECKNGHTFCKEHHLLGKDIERIQDCEQQDYDEEWSYQFPIEGCPICMNKAINPKEAYEAIKTISKITDEEIIEIIKQYRELKK